MSARLFMLAMAWGLAASTGMLLAQNANSPGEGLCAVPGSTPGVMQICWWGKTGRTYFLQTNPTLSPLTWSYADMVEMGGSAVLSYSLVQSPSERIFVRLVYTDQPNGGNAAAADFDGDGLTNAEEVAAGGPHSDPFVRDTDWDGYSDADETLAGSGANNQQSNPNTTTPSGDLNPDAGYRYGLRLDYAQKYMTADYSGSLPETGTASHSTYVSAHHSGNPIQWIQAAETFTTGDKTSDLVSQYLNADFLAPSYRLFNGSGGFWMDCNWNFSDYTHPTTHNRSIHSETNRTMMEVTVAASPGAPGWARRSIVMLFYKNGWTANYITKAGRIMVSPQNLKVEESVADHVKTGAAAGRIVISPKIESSAEDDDPSSDGIHWFQDLHAYLFDLDIEPDENMAGVIGDVVPSKKPDSFVRHFVTPKLTTEIPATHVELKAGGVSAADFTTFFEWEGDGEQGSASNKYKVSRAETGEGPKKVKIKNKQTGATVAEMHVWVVWCENTLAENLGYNAAYTDGTYYYPKLAKVRFEFEVFPKNLITGYNDNSIEVPDLGGPNDTTPQGIISNGVNFGGGVIYKWDVSRRFGIQHNNPGETPSIVKADLRAPPGPAGDGLAGANLAANTATILSLPAEGMSNDDQNEESQANNPYSDAESGFQIPDPTQQNVRVTVKPAIGKLGSCDVPKMPAIRLQAGAEGEEVGWTASFQEFVRLEINRKWYRVSAYKNWTYQSLFKKVGLMEDNGTAVTP